MNWFVQRQNQQQKILKSQCRQVESEPEICKYHTYLAD